jgi:hypothetical protein
MSGAAPDAAFATIFGSVDASVAGIGRALHSRVLALHPESTVIAYPGYDAVSYGFGPKKNSEAYIYLMPQKGRCNLGFYRGRSLPDPEGLLEGTGKDLRHLKVGDMAMAESGAVGQLIEAAIDERRSGLGIN